MGAIQLLLGLFRMGFIVSFLSKPVIGGFTSAAAIIIGFSQLKHLLEFNSQSNQLHIVIESILQSNVPVHLATLIIGVLSVVLILVINNWNRKIPSALIAVVLGSRGYILTG